MGGGKEGEEEGREEGGLGEEESGPGEAERREGRKRRFGDVEQNFFDNVKYLTERRGGRVVGMGRAAVGGRPCPLCLHLEGEGVVACSRCGGEISG